MTDSHLFCVALGPVQSFIEAARRMRDLHQGSRILSDVALGLAQRLSQQHRATLIFPSLDALAPTAADAGDTTNKLLCVLPGQLDPAAVARDLSTTLIRILEDLGEACLNELEEIRLDGAVHRAEFRHQLADCLQLYAAWSPLASTAIGDGPAYAKAYLQVNQALEARKLTRSFAPNLDAPDGVQLSSLDGLRESVLLDARNDIDDASIRVVNRLRSRLGLSAGEHLDSMGLTKRTLGRSAPFPAVSRVALQPWIEGMGQRHPNVLQELEVCMKALEKVDIARRNGRLAGEPLGELPFDCEVLLPGRLDVLRRQLEHRDDLDDSQLGSGHRALDDLEQLLSRKDAQGQYVVDIPREDSPHIALLMADGDKMGVLLSELAHLQGAKGHTAMARCMQSTAALAHRIVREHGGCVLYAGGDDVMAALPVQSAIACAQALQSQLTSLLQQALPPGLAERATLSMGLAMAHVLTPMGQVRKQAQKALQWAKSGPPGARAPHNLRDALCVWVEPRGGVGRACVGRWRGVGQHSMVQRLSHWQAAFRAGEVSRSLPYDLINEVSGEEPWAIPLAIQRLLLRRLNGDQASATRLAVDIADLIKFWAEFAPRQVKDQWIGDRLADELYVSRWLQAHPRPSSNTMAVESGAVHA